MDQTTSNLLNNNTDLPSTTQPTNQPLYLIRLSQSHESFRLPELKSLATYFNIPLSIISYSPTSPFCIVSFPSTPGPLHPSLKTHNPPPTHDLAKHFISRSILSKAIYHLYAHAPTYDTLHTQVKALDLSTWTPFETVSFKFSLDAFRGKRSVREQREIVEGFSYLPFKGRIQMNGAEEEFVVFEEWDGVMTAEDHAALRVGMSEWKNTGSVNGESVSRTVPKTTTTLTSTSTSTSPPPPLINHPTSQRKPRYIYFARLLGSSQRHLVDKHDLKKRPYISTTSMDAELALITALMAHAGPGRLILDPFVGTGGFMVAAAELGAITMGSDIDGRSFRGKGSGMKRGVLANFERYGIVGGFGDCLTGDLTNSPLRVGRGMKRWLDAIICDPPYGVREGLKVLGRKVQSVDDGVSLVSSIQNGDGEELAIPSGTPSSQGPIFVDGVPSHTLPGFIAPKRPYSFDRMLGDILDFAARTLVDGGRLAFWMPCANEAEEEFGTPTDPKGLVVLRHVCVQVFNKWSRRLLVYERMPGEVFDGQKTEGDVPRMVLSGTGGVNGHHADDLNQFRRMYFQGFNRGTMSTKTENG